MKLIEKSRAHTSKGVMVWPCLMGWCLTVMQTFDFVTGLHNCQILPTPLVFISGCVNMKRFSTA